ncbi:hypothetical protein PHPALM_18737 [Phytophthora palmivora]|uniref:Uncharacterized protein n=1 Tax=Phytophthora palmivora TaxID=4796 RepID=A0A2P4XJ06_9STRA|nr:hypothetical protein PHPALM_18737 [Phytophthora palmivora]
MAPFSTSDTKIGSANEENIAVHISSFLDKHSQRGMPIAAFTPDNVASILNTRRGRFHAIMEYKTRTTARTVQKEQVLANSWGRFLTVDVSAMGFGGRLCDVIPEASHRLQLLHSIACGGVQDGFLVYASATAIIRVVHVVVEPGVSWTYRTALEAIQKGYLTWIYDDNAAVPHFDPAHQGHCSHSFLMNRLTCTTYKAYQKHKQNLPSFAAFCREAAVALSKMNKASQPLKPISENISESSTFEVGTTFSYKKRLHFETEKEWIDLRLSKAKTHIAVLSVQLPIPIFV